MKRTKIVYPVNDILAVSELIKCCGNSSCIQLSTGSIFDPSSTVTFSTILLESGEFSFHRKQDGMLMFTLQAPFPVGITSSVAHGRNFYIKMITPAKMTIVPFEQFTELVEKENAWKRVVNILTYLIDLNEEYIRLFLLGSNSYEMIKTGLNQIWELPEEERMKVSLYKFIQSRYTISRSSIDKIIRDLKAGGYIKTSRGCLLEMKALPEKY